MAGAFTLSVVSHHHQQQVQTLLAQLAQAPAGLFDKIIVTINVPEKPPDSPIACLQVICNQQPRGFGSNHNHAFSLCRSPYFCVINPDIELIDCANARQPVARLPAGDDQNFVKTLFECMADTLSAAQSDNMGLAYPAQCSADGRELQYARPLVTPPALLARKIRQLLRLEEINHKKATPDWASGAFLVFKSEVFAALKGFDERYFMYCEDVDICLRAQLLGYTLGSAPASVVHHAQQRTLKSSQHLAWHVRSLLRLWNSGAYRQYVVMKKNKK